MSAERLPELPEAAATGRTAEVYADIRAVLGLPIVNLVYRHLATRPGLLEECWAALRPNLASRAASSASEQLVQLAAPPDITALPRASLAVTGLTGEQVTLARATLATYRRANSRNLLGMFALLDGCNGNGADLEGEVAPAPQPILPMASLEDLPPSAAALLDEMSLHIVGGEQPRLVPSLLRHFAADACLLALLWTVLQPATATASRQATIIATNARELIHSLPHPVEALHDEGGRAVLTTFSGAMARMLLLGEILSAALAEAV